MTDWCSNYIKISSRPDEDKTPLRRINSVIESIQDKDDPIVFRSLVGEGDKVNGRTHNENCNDWYGTELDSSVNELGYDFTDPSDMMYMSIETPWTPPLKFCEKLCNIFGVEINIEYSEQHADFYGITWFRKVDGIVVQTTGDYPYIEGCYRYNRELFWDEIQAMIEVEVTDNEIETGERFADEYGFVYEQDRFEIIRRFNDEQKQINEINK